MGFHTNKPPFKCKEILKISWMVSVGEILKQICDIFCFLFSVFLFGLEFHWTDISTCASIADWISVTYTLLYEALETCLSGLFDQIIHSAENVDMVELYKHLHAKVSVVNITEFLRHPFCRSMISIFYLSSGYARIAHAGGNKSSFMFSWFCYWLWSYLLPSHLEWGLLHSLVSYIVLVALFSY